MRPRDHILRRPDTALRSFEPVLRRRPFAVGLSVLLWLSVCGWLNAESIENAKVTTAALRVSSAHRYVRFSLPHRIGQTLLAPGTTLVVKAPPSPETACLKLENGAMIFSAPAASSGTPPGIEGSTDRISVPSGEFFFWRSAVRNEEGGASLSGQITSAAGVSIGLTAENLLTVTDRVTPSGSLPAPEESGHLDRLKSLLGTARDPDLIDLPGTVPPSPDPERRPVSATTGVAVSRLAASACVVSIPEAITALTTVNLPSPRQRFVISVPGEGLSGAGFYLDCSPLGARSTRNLVWTGPRVFVRFFLHPEWLVTLAPGSIVSLEASALESRSRSKSRIRLTRGAMLFESRERSQGTTRTYEGLGGATLEGETASLAASRTILVAQPARGESRLDSLVRARELLQPAFSVDSGPVKDVQASSAAQPEARTGSVRPDAARTATQTVAAATSKPTLKTGPRDYVFVTILESLPVEDRSLSRFMSLHVRSREKTSQLEICTLSPPPSAGEACASLIELKTPGEGPIPAALILPKQIPVSPSNGTPCRLLLSRIWSDLFDLREVSRKTNPTPVLELSSHSLLSLKNVLLAVILGIVPWILLRRFIRSAWLKLVLLGEWLLGISGRRCPDCGLVLQTYPIGEFSLEEDQEPLKLFLRYDFITMVSQQQKAKSTILDKIASRGHGGVSAKHRYRVTGYVCQRCLSGRFLAEVVSGDRSLDEASWEFHNCDTQELLNEFARVRSSGGSETAVR